MSEFVERLKQNKKRLIIGGLLGVGLASLLIWILSSVYDPFVEPVSDILVFTPKDADFVLFSRDFPTLIAGLDDREFIRQVDQNRNLQRWLNSPKMIKTEIIPSLRGAYGRLREIDSMLPFDLHVLGDLSGHEVMVAGYEATSPDDPFSIVAVVQPESAMAQVAVNALLDPTLCNFFVADKLPAGATIEHFNWGARIDLPSDGGKPVSIGVARIEAAVILGTNVSAVTEMVRDLAANGIPIFPLSRFEPGWVWEGAETSGVNLMIRRRTFDDRVRIMEDWLTPMWGPALAAVFAEALPLFEGQDLYLQLDIAAAARLKGAIGVDARRPPDLMSRMSVIDEGIIADQTRQIISKLPHYVFGYGLFGAEPADLVSFALARRNLVDNDQRELLYELLSHLDRFKSLRFEDDETPDLTGPLITEVGSIFGSDVGFILFKKQRIEEVHHSAPGVAVVLRVRDRSRLEGFLAELEVAAEQPFHHFDEPPFPFWQVVRDDFLDDKENNRPAFALIGDYLVVTNWVQLFVDMREVIAEQAPSLPSRDNLDYSLEDLADGSRGFLFLDPEQLYAHMDLAKEGWIAERSTVTAFEMVDLRRAATEAWRQQIEPRPDQEAWVEREYQRRLRKLEADRSEAKIRAGIEQNLEYFRNAFSYLFVSIGRRDQEFRLDLRLATQENY